MFTDDRPSAVLLAVILTPILCDHEPHTRFRSRDEISPVKLFCYHGKTSRYPVITHFTLLLARTTDRTVSNVAEEIN